MLEIAARYNPVMNSTCIQLQCFIFSYTIAGMSKVSFFQKVIVYKVLLIFNQLIREVTFEDRNA